MIQRVFSIITRKYVVTIHSVQRGINLPLENYPRPLIGQAPLKMKIFWPPPNFCSFPDFILEESVWHAINLWGHWKACSFTRDQNHSSNHSGVIKNFIFIKWHYIQVELNPFQANVQFLCHLKISEHLFSRTPPSDCISRLS